MKMIKQRFKNIFWRGFDFISPSFTELHVIVMFTIVTAMFFLSDDARHNILHFDDQLALILIYLPFLLLMFTLIIVNKEKMDNGSKSFLINVYYAFIAILSGLSLSKQLAFSGEDSLFEQANVLLTCFLLVSAIIRFSIAYFLSDGKSSGKDKFILANLRDDQYKYSAFIVTVLITSVIVIWFSRIYESTATIAILSFGYISILLSVLDPLLKRYAVTKGNNSKTRIRV